ncbi:MAG: hypothetical protein WBG30_08905 [Psychrilyobacter sp.]
MNLAMMELLGEKYRDTGISLADAYLLEINKKKEISTGIDTSK